MQDQSRIFDFLYGQLRQFPKEDMLCAKVNGQWEKFSTTRVADMVNRLSAGLIGLGLSGHDMTVEKQDKVAIISRNRPEWLILDMACQQIGVVLCRYSEAGDLRDELGLEQDYREYAPR